MYEHETMFGRKNIYNNIQFDKYFNESEMLKASNLKNNIFFLHHLCISLVFANAKLSFRNPTSNEPCKQA